MEREKLIKSKGYWLTNFQCEAFRLLDDYMKENDLTKHEVAEQMDVPLRYISKILNGNFNSKLSKFIELSLFVGKVPVLNFDSFEKYLEDEKGNSK